MKRGLITEKLACAARTDAADARHWETEPPNTSEITCLHLRNTRVSCSKEGLGFETPLPSTREADKQGCNTSTAKKCVAMGPVPASQYPYDPSLTWA